MNTPKNTTQTTTQDIPDLFSDLDFGSMSEEEKETLLDDIGESVFDGAIFRVIETLPEKDAEELDRLLQENEEDPENEEKDQALNDFFAEKVPDFPRFIQEEAFLLHEEWVQNIKKAKQSHE